MHVIKRKFIQIIIYHTGHLHKTRKTFLTLKPLIIVHSGLITAKHNGDTFYVSVNIEGKLASPTMPGSKQNTSYD